MAVLHQLFEHHLQVYSIMQSVKGAQILNITFLFVLFTAVPAAAVFVTVIVALASMYASL